MSREFISYTPPAWQPGWNKTPSVTVATTPIKNVPSTLQRKTGMKIHKKEGWEYVKLSEVPMDIIYQAESEVYDETAKGYLHYPGRIDTNQVIDYDGKVWQLPKALWGIFYIEDLWVPVYERLECLIAKGYNAHVNDDRHSYNLACIGDLQGAPIDDYDKLLDMFKYTNMTNNFNNDCFDLLCIVVGDDGNGLNYEPGDDREADRFFAYQGACTDNPHPAVQRLLELEHEELKPICCFDANRW